MEIKNKKILGDPLINTNETNTLIRYCGLELSHLLAGGMRLVILSQVNKAIQFTAKSDAIVSNMLENDSVKASNKDLSNFLLDCTNVFYFKID